MLQRHAFLGALDRILLQQLLVQLGVRLLDQLALLLLAALFRSLSDLVVLLALDLVDALVLLLLVEEQRLHLGQLLIACLHVLHAQLVHLQIVALLVADILLLHFTLFENLAFTGRGIAYHVDLLLHVGGGLELGGHGVGRQLEVVRLGIFKTNKLALAVLYDDSVPDVDLFLGFFIGDLRG